MSEPDSDREVIVIFEDGHEAVGFWLGADPYLPLNGWMYDATEDFCRQSDDHGEIVSWREREVAL